jgi:hypothetical protein
MTDFARLSADELQRRPPWPDYHHHRPPLGPDGPANLLERQARLIPVNKRGIAFSPWVCHYI